MYRVLFGMQTMVLGGVEKELITLLNKMKSLNVDITLLLLYIEDEEILKEIPSYVKIVNLNIDKKYYCSGTKTLFAERLKRGKITEAFEILIKRALKIGMPHSNTNISSILALEGKYDVAICYHAHSPLMVKYIAQKTEAKRKIVWFHNEFFATGYQIEKLLPFLNSYDTAVGVSKKVSNEFKVLCKMYTGQVLVAYNILDNDEIISKSEICIHDDKYFEENKLKLLTVARFTKQKGIEVALEATRILNEKNKEIHWFLIGYGELEDTYKKIISDYEIEDCFTILGKKENPYPYIKACDIYIQPSMHEAFGLVIKEAKILKKAIICTDFAGADEQIVNGKNGYIVPISDAYALVKKIEFLINHPEERIRISSITSEINEERDFERIVNIIIK